MVSLYRFGADSNKRFQGELSQNCTRSFGMRMWPFFIQGTINNVSMTGATHTVSAGLPQQEDVSEEATIQNRNETALSARKPATWPPLYKTADGTKHWVRRKGLKFSEIEALIPKLQAAADYLSERYQTLPKTQPQTPKSTRLFLDSAAEAQYANADMSIPATRAEKLALIKQLVAAIADTSNCLTTSSSSAAYQKCWGAGATFDYPSQIEVVTWALLQLMIDIHQRGWSIADSDLKQRDDVCLGIKLTFGERTNVLLRVLLISRSTCEALIEGDRGPELDGCPHVVFERVHGHYESSAGRGQGREGTAARKKCGKGAGNNDDESGARTAKKRKMVGKAEKGEPKSCNKTMLDQSRRKTQRAAKKKSDDWKFASVSIAQSVFDTDTSFVDEVRNAIFSGCAFAQFGPPAQ